MTAAEIKERNPLVSFLEKRDIQLKRSGGELATNRCPQTEHKAGHLCVSVNAEKNVWRCHDCDVGGTIIDWLMQETGKALPEVLASFGEDTAAPPRREASRAAPEQKTAARGRIVKTYPYTDENGIALFEVVRYEPKDFRQRRPDGTWGLNGTVRVLYNLPRVKTSDFVWIVEGEKDADNINALGMVATCNAGGAGKWEPQYADTLRDKEVIICGDNDKAGLEHVELLKKELAPVAKSVRVVRVPAPHKDVSDFMASCERPATAMRQLVDAAGEAEVTHRGRTIPVRSMEELERDYEAFTQEAHLVSLDLGLWLPTLGRAVRPLVPGELACIMADTGVGKTMLLQNIAIHTTLPTLLFEIELPGTLTFERFAGIATKRPAGNVFSTYRMKDRVDWRGTNKLGHISVCCESRLTPPDIERIITGAGIKTGSRPIIVMLDYVQLIRGAGKSRYENMSVVAEELKVIAKEANCIMLIASQVARKNEEAEIGLHDAKDSGSIENSSGLVLGAWRDSHDKGRLHVKVCKNTKGFSGKIVNCRIDESLRIDEEHDHPA